MEYETTQIKINECERVNILTVSPDDILTDDKTWTPPS